MCILDDINNYENKINKETMFYRVKTNKHRLRDDILIYKKLLKFIYNID